MRILLKCSWIVKQIFTKKIAEEIVIFIRPHGKVKFEAYIQKNNCIEVGSFHFQVMKLSLKFSSIMELKSIPKTTIYKSRYISRHVTVKSITMYLFKIW